MAGGVVVILLRLVNPQFVLLLLVSIGFNYSLGYAIGHVRGSSALGARPKRILITAIGGNLLLLWTALMEEM
jgi:hypothetical protein